MTLSLTSVKHYSFPEGFFIDLVHRSMGSLSNPPIEPWILVSKYLSS